MMMSGCVRQGPFGETKSEVLSFYVQANTQSLEYPRGKPLNSKLLEEPGWRFCRGPVSTQDQC